MPTPTYNIRVRRDARTALKAVADLLNLFPESAEQVLSTAKRLHHTIATQHPAEGAGA
jgi:hypothetical protein